MSEDHPIARIPKGDSKLFQIYEQDLAELERILPEFMNFIAFQPEWNQSNIWKVRFRKVIDIVKNVRWNYGPPEETHSGKEPE